MARRKVKSDVVGKTAVDGLVAKAIDPSVIRMTHPKEMIDKTDHELMRMLNALERAEGFFVSYTTLVPDPNDPKKKLLHHTVTHKNFPIGDVLPSIRKIKELGVNLLENRPGDFGSEDLAEHIE